MVDWAQVGGSVDLPWGLWYGRIQMAGLAFRLFVVSPCGLLQKAGWASDLAAQDSHSAKRMKVGIVSFLKGEA